MNSKDAWVSEEKLRELLFYSDEFRIILKKGREYVAYINPKLKEKPWMIDEYVAHLVIEQCMKRFEFDSTGRLSSEHKLMQDVKRFVLQGRFFGIV